MPNKLKLWLPPIFIIFIALWSVWPVLVSPTSVLTNGNEDILIVWILNQTIDKIPSALGDIFQANIFYPYKNVMAFTDLLIPSAIVSYLPVKISNQPIVSFNFALIVGQIATMLVIYFWWKDMAKSIPAAFLGAIVLGLSQIRILYFAHLQMWTMQWWLISVWMIWRYTKNSRVWQLYLGGAFLVIQVWESVLPVFWIVMVGAIILWPKLPELKRHWKHILIVVIGVLVLTLPVTSTYLGVSRELDVQRSIRDAAHFSLSVEQFWGQFASPALFILLILAFLGRSLSSWRKDRDFKWLLIVLIISFLFALGPVLKIDGQTFRIFGFPIPLPYAIAYYVVPGFTALRTPTRWLWPFAFAASGIIALGFKKYSLKKGLLVVILAITLAVLGGTRIKDTVRIVSPRQYPGVYHWLSTQDAGVILELPVYTVADRQLLNREIYRMLYSLEHKKQLVNGYSGFSPPQWQQLIAEIRSDFPNEELELKISDLGVDYIIVHKNELDKQKLEEIKKWGMNKLIFEDSKTNVYKL